MNKVMQFHVLRLALIVGSLLFLVFWMGWIMGKKNEQEALDALISGNSAGAVNLSVQWTREERMKSPVFYLAAARQWAERGNTENVKHNLDMAFKLMGK